MVRKNLEKHMQSDFAKIRPLSVSQVIRGTSILNPLKLQAAYGLPFRGLKKDDIVRGTLEEPFLAAWMAERTIENLKRLDRDEPVFNIAEGKLKDEIISKEKIDQGLERMFFSVNTDFVFLCKMYFGPLAECFIANRNKISAQIGMNATSQEFSDRFYSLFKEFNPTATYEQFLDFASSAKRWLDRDYKKFDKRLLLVRYACIIIYEIFKRIPYFKAHPKELNRVRLLLQSVSQYIVIINGCVFLMKKGNASGQLLTSILNCLGEEVSEIVEFYWCYCIYKTGREPTSPSFVRHYAKEINFYDHIKLLNYGDDNTKLASELAILFCTHKSIMSYSEFICMPITPADKNQTQLEWKELINTTFLKRTPVFVPQTGIIMGQLEEMSIARMLCFTDSNSPTWERDVLDQARRELSIHDPKKYEKFCEVFHITIPIEQSIQDLLTNKWFVPEMEVPWLKEQFEEVYLQAEPGLTKQAD